MCEETYFIAASIERMKDCIPDEIETSLDFIKNDAFHLAPEIAHEHWFKIYDYLSNNFQDASVSWQSKLCQIYNEEYQKYKQRFVK